MDQFVSFFMNSLLFLDLGHPYQQPLTLMNNLPHFSFLQTTLYILFLFSILCPCIFLSVIFVSIMFID